MKRLAIAGAIVAALAAAGAAVAAGPLRVQTSISPEFSYFADTVTARLDVLYDPRQVDASSIQVVNPSFGIWSEGAPARSTISNGGTVARRTWWYTISCLTFGCVPKGPKVQVFRLPVATVEAKTRAGATVRVRRSWPVLNVAGRFLPPALPDVRPKLRIETQVPAPTYAVDPTVLANALDGLGGVAIAIAIVLGGVAIARGWIARHPLVDNRPPLVRALALVRQAQDRKPADRRRAAGLLARTIPEEGNGLTALAAEVAWSKAEPSPSRLEELARTVEAELEEKS